MQVCLHVLSTRAEIASWPLGILATLDVLRASDQTIEEREQSILFGITNLPS